MTRDEAKDRVIEAARILTRGYTFRKVEEHNLKDAIAALDSTLDSEGGWRPISEAPPEHELILLYSSDFRGCDTALFSGSHSSIEHTGATHWMPIPAPPSQEPS